MTATPKIKQRIQQLLAKAKGTDNEHEADAFLAKAMELLQQHQLDIADLVDAGDPILHHVGLSQASSGHAWRWRLYSVVAQLYGCQSIHAQVGYRQVKVKGRIKLTAWYEQRLVGRESSIITTDLMYPWIVQQVRAKARAIAGVTGMSEQGQAKRVAAALIIRIHRLIEAQQTTAPTTAAGRNALIILNQAVAKFNELYPQAQTINRSVKFDDLSREAAEGIGLHRQTTGERPLALGER